MKTRWKLFNSARKTGAMTGLLHTFHRVFNLWKNYRAFTECIDVFCGKLLTLAKRRNCTPPTGQRAKHFYSCRNRQEGTLFTEKILAPGNKISAICGEAGRDMVYFILDYHKQNKTFLCGAARPERKEHKKMEERNQPRRPRRDAEQPQQKSESLIYGKNPVTELLKSGSGVDTVLIAEGMAPAVAAYYTALAKEAGATVKRVHPNKLRLMTGTESHQGVAAFASVIEYATVEDLLAAAKAKGEPPFLVLSDGIEDPHNLGAVMRSALLCGAHGIVIPKRGGASVTPTVIKSSAGAAERLPVARVANIGETIRRLKEQGVFVYCADMDGVSLRKNNLTGPIALVLGSEGSGVSQLVKKLCDGVVRLDMAAPGTGVDSYNVSVAAGIILYEIQSQRAVEE